MCNSSSKDQWESEQEVKTKLSVEEYRTAVTTCALVAGLLSEHNIPELLKAIEHAHAVGPILDPTLYRDKVQAMEEDKQLLLAALPLAQWGMNAKKKSIQKPEEYRKAHTPEEV